MSKIIAVSTVMQQLHDRVAELYPTLGKNQTYLQVRKEFRGRLAPNAIRKAVMVYRCGSEAKYDQVKKFIKGGNKHHAQRSSGNQESQGQTAGDPGSGQETSAHNQTSE